MLFSSLWQVWELDGKNLPDVEHFKISDRKNDHDLSVDAKILIALMRKQPQSREELIKSGKISNTSFYRNIKLLIKREILKKDKTGYSFIDFVAEPDYWNKIKNKFAEVGADLIEITLQKALEGDYHPITGHLQFTYETEYSAKVIVIMKNAPELVRIATQFFNISFRDKYENKDYNKEYAGVVLTQDSINSMDLFIWKNWLYKIWRTEDRDDGYNFSFRIGYLEGLYPIS